MSLALLQEMIQLAEAPTVDGITQAWKATKDGYSASRASFSKNREKKATAAEKVKADLKKAAAQLDADETAVVKKLTTDFIAEFFQKFPNFGSTAGPEEIRKYLKNKGQALASYKIFKNLAAELEKMLDKFNQANLSAPSNKNNLARFKQAIALGKKNRHQAPPQALIKFVRGEQIFFKRLISFDASFELNDTSFVNTMASKYNATDAARKLDAFAALNQILSYMIEEINAYALHIADAGHQLSAATEANP